MANTISKRQWIAAALLGLAAGTGAHGAGTLLVSSDFGHEVLRYDAQSGGFVGTFIPAAASGGLSEPHGILAQRHTVLVASFTNDRVLRYDRVTGAFIDVFIDDSNGLDAPVVLQIGPDGALYVTSQLSDEVHRYDADTGAFLGVFVTAGSGGLDGPSGMRFGPDGRLYVAGRHSADVIAYNGLTGAFDEVVVDSVDGLTSGNTYGLSFSPAGDLYVASAGVIHRVDVVAGSVTSTIGVNSIGVAHGADGNLYAARGGADQLAQINGVSDAVITNTFLGAGANAPNLLNFFHFAAPIIGDINGDDVVDSSDLGQLILMFGDAGGPADINGDGIVNTSDLGLLIGNFG